MKSRVMQLCRRQAVVVMAAAFMSVSAPFAAAQETSEPIKHAQGQTVVSAVPGKTVVFDMAALDILNALGVQATAVPTGTFPPFLAAYADKSVPKVGTLFEPDYEAVNSISPDLIIVGGRSAPKYRDLSKLAPTIDLTVDPKDLVGSVARNTRTLAKIYDKEDEGEALLAKLNDSIKALHAKAADKGPGLVVLTVGGKMSAYGPGSRFGLIHDAFGVPPAVEGLATTNHGQAISFEFIFKNDPEWLFVIDRDAAIGREGTPARQLLDNALIHKTKAWKKNQIVYLNSMNWYLLGSAGLTSMQQNIEQLSQALDGQP